MTERDEMEIEGIVVEMGDLYGLNTPGLRMEVGDQLVEIVGLTREQIRSMPPVMFKRVTLRIEAAK